MPDPNYFADDPASPISQRLHKLLASIEALSTEQKAAGETLRKLVAESTKKGGEAMKVVVDTLRNEVRTEFVKVAKQVEEVRRASVKLEGGVGETKAAIVELVAYDRERRVREDAERVKAEQAQRLARAQDLDRSGRAHHRAGRREEAAAVLGEARSLDPENAGILSDLGAALLAGGKTGPAEDPLRRAVRADEAFAPARANLGFLLLRSGSLEDAERHLEEAVRLDPNLGPAWNSLGNARWLRGRHASAIEAWHRAWKADPLCLAAGRNLRRQQEIA